MKYIFWDTETTGFPNFKARHGDESQPHLVQIAARLTDAEGETLEQYNTLIDPRGWYLEMPPDAEKAHQKSYQMCLSDGVPLLQAMRKFNSLLRKADVAVAHNKTFDEKIARICWTRVNLWPLGYGQDAFAKSECSMALSTPLVNLPPTEKMLKANRRGPKSASLTEAYEFFFGEKFDNAHDAGADTLACCKVYFAAKSMLAARATQTESL